MQRSPLRKSFWPSRRHCLHCGLVSRAMAATPLDAPPLARPAAVVGLRGHVANPGHLEAGGLEGADRGLAAGAGTLDEDLDLLQAVLDALACRRVGRHLRGERRRLARASEAGAAGGLPRDHVPLAVCQGDDLVVEAGLGVGLAHRDVLADSAAAALRTLRCWAHLLLPRLLLAGHLHALRALARARVRLGSLTADREAATVALAAVAAGLHQALDVLRALAAQVALDDEISVDLVAELRDLVLGEVADVGVRRDAELGEKLVRLGPADAVDVRETDLDALVQRDVDACYTSHRVRPTPA